MKDLWYESPALCMLEIEVEAGIAQSDPGNYPSLGEGSEEDF